MWELWLARNKTIFQGKLPLMQSIFAKICGLILEVFRIKAIDFDPPGTLEPSEEDWVAYIRGPTKNTLNTPRKAPKQQDWQLCLDNNSFLHWQNQEHSFFLFFDGATTGNPGVAGVRGVMYDSEGKKIIDYAWGLGKTTKNKA
jgi:hypothetical protein